MYCLLHGVPRFFDSLPGGIVLIFYQMLSIRTFGRRDIGFGVYPVVSPFTSVAYLSNQIVEIVDID